jgi:hypothetical protein
MRPRALANIHVVSKVGAERSLIVQLISSRWGCILQPQGQRESRGREASGSVKQAAAIQTPVWRPRACPYLVDGAAKRFCDWARFSVIPAKAGREQSVLPSWFLAGLGFGRVGSSADPAVRYGARKSAALPHWSTASQKEAAILALIRSLQKQGDLQPARGTRGRPRRPVPHGLLPRLPRAMRTTTNACVLVLKYAQQGAPHHLPCRRREVAIALRATPAPPSPRLLQRIVKPPRPAQHNLRSRLPQRNRAHGLRHRCL